MDIIVIGGGKVGFYLAKELAESNHEVLVIEQDPQKVQEIQDELGDIAMEGDGCEASVLEKAGTSRADMLLAVTGDDEDNLVACQVAKMRFSVPRAIARVSNPKNEKLFRQLAIDETVSPTRTILGMIEHEIPVHDLLHLAELEGGEVQVIEAQLDGDAPVIGREVRELDLPEGTNVAVLIRDGRAIPSRPEIRLRSGDRLLLITSADREDELRSLFIGE
ncbi:MAG TPA: NAD-binding protein [Candidatus Limnocylindria bacterium]|nr:NAD-binding protein [Candidatus Limnocylindria bacterium]